jgi:tetratricopeptide (TPR) repeat protein
MTEAADATLTVAPDEEPDSFAPPRLRVGVLVGGRYEIVDRLGAGGHATVFRAFDRQLESAVALKVLRRGTAGSDALRRLRREAMVARSLQHPALVRNYDFCQQPDGLTFLVMELVEGETWAQRLRRGRPSVEETLATARSVLEALAHLHERGVIHRDVKPSNVLVTEAGDVKLADYGLALLLDGDHTRLTAADGMVGTLDYLSPEQALGQRVGPASDLFGFGVLLFESLTGRLPFPGDSTMGRVLLRISTPPRRPSKLRRGIPRWLDRFVVRLLERRPEHRYADAGAALEDLLRERVGGLPRPLRSRRRRWAVTGALLLVVVALVVLRVATRPRFARLVPLDAKRLTAVDQNGRALFTLENVEEVSALPGVRTARGEPPRIAAFRHSDRRGPTDDHRRLLLYDQRSGRLDRTVDLSAITSDRQFEGFAPRFRPQLRALDLDRDGGHELLITWSHFYQPSYTALWEPRADRVRPLFAGSGHHLFLDAADLDGDGREEILLEGVNSELGWNRALAALRLDPPVHSRAPLRDGARSPDLPYPDGASLLWYALVPGDACDGSQAPCFSVDPERRQLRSAGAAPWVLDFDGFPRHAANPLPAAEREKARRAAYASLRSATAMQRADDGDAAWRAFHEAVAHATRAGDPVLLGWLERTRARLLALTAEAEAAERLFEELAARPAPTRQVTSEAGAAFHLAGDLERAIAWYRRSLPETLEGLVLALGELGDWEGALLEIDRFEATMHSHRDQAELYRALVRWLSGRLLESPDWPRAGQDDRRAYLQLEVAHRLGSGTAAELLSQVENEIEVASFARVPLLSLRAVLLSELGRTGEAVAQAREAHAQARVEGRYRILVRGLTPLIAERSARIERAAAAR